MGDRPYTLLEPDSHLALRKLAVALTEREERFVSLKEAASVAIIEKLEQVNGGAKPTRKGRR